MILDRLYRQMTAVARTVASIAAIQTKKHSILPIFTNLAELLRLIGTLTCGLPKTAGSRHP